MKYFIVFLSILSVGLGVLGVMHYKVNVMQEEPQVVAPQDTPPPAPAPQQVDPPQYQYLYVVPGSPYYVLPPNCPIEYRTRPLFYFYYVPCYPYFQPGISICIGGGFWFTPGIGLINIGFYCHAHPFPTIVVGEHHRVVTCPNNITHNSVVVHNDKIINVHNDGHHEQPHNPPHREEHHVNPPQHQQPHNNPPPAPHNNNRKR